MEVVGIVGEERDLGEDAVLCSWAVGRVGVADVVRVEVGEVVVSAADGGEVCADL